MSGSRGGSIAFGLGGRRGLTLIYVGNAAMHGITITVTLLYNSTVHCFHYNMLLNQLVVETSIHCVQRPVKQLQTCVLLVRSDIMSSGFA